MSVIDPDTVRASSHLKNGKLEIHGVEFETISELVKVGHLLTDYRAKITVDAMKKALDKDKSN